MIGTNTLPTNAMSAVKQVKTVATYASRHRAKTETFTPAFIVKSHGMLIAFRDTFKSLGAASIATSD